MKFNVFLLSYEQTSMILSIVLVTIIFIIFLLLTLNSYSNFKVKIKNNDLKKEYEKDIKSYKKRFKDNRTRAFEFTKVNTTTTINLSPYRYKEWDSDYIDVPQYYVRQEKKKEKDPNKELKKLKAIKVFKIISNTILAVLIIAMLGLGVYIKISNSLLEIDNVAYVTIMTGSMNSKHESNTYLEENNLDNQLPTFSLIGLERLDENTELSLYDICAYRNVNGALIVHRIVNIEDRDGVTYYTFKGDANELVDYYALTRDQILYQYNGFINVPAGYFISFVSSYVGMAGLVLSMLFIYILEAQHKKEMKLYEAHLKERVEALNKEEIEALGDTKVIVF